MFINLSPQNQCLLKPTLILSSWIPLLFSPVEKIFSQVETHANTSLQPNIHKIWSSKGCCSLWRFVFLYPYIKSDSIFIETTPPVNICDVIKACFDIINAGRNQALNVKWHQNQKNDACATSISCQKGVNRRIFFCDRIEIRIREVISDENDTIIRKMFIFGRMWLLKNTIYMTNSGGAKCRKEPTSPMVLNTALPLARQPLL